MFFRISTIAVVVTTFFHLFAVSGVNGLNCIQCAGSPFFNESCFNGKVAATKCQHDNYTFCLSYIGRLGGINTPMVIRSCSPSNMSTECQVRSVENSGNREITVCFYTCNTDGCNNIVHQVSDAFSPRSSSFLLIFSLLFSSASVHLLR